MGMFYTRPDASLQFPRFSCIFPRLAAASLQFPRQTLTLPCNSRKTRKPENPKTREPEITGPEPCTGMTRPDPVSQCGQVPPQIFPNSYCSIVLVVLFAVPHLVVFPEPSKFLPCSFHVSSMFLFLFPSDPLTCNTFS